MLRVLLACSIVLLMALPSWAKPVDFVRDVKPILQRHCYKCHGPDKQKSGLRLDVKSKAFAGGELFGASIVARQPGKSPLVRFVSEDDAELRMPPGRKRLSEKEVATLVRWVEEGATWPREADAVLVDRKDHWSLKPVARVAVPRTRDVSWPSSTIDRFVLARLERAGLRPSKEASRSAWLRRVSFDLIGLPPTPEQVREFVEDRGPDAFERVVDRLLASPHYGERWAQHWLDVVRYADTHGFEVNTERPNAWPYRDYVIEAFNRGTSYDQFVREQIIGDKLGQGAGTGFLLTASVLLPGQIGKDEPSKRLARQDALDEIVVNISQSFLGLSVGCARCHDHKFDAIPQRDYYSMQAFVAGVEYADREVAIPSAAATLRRLREELREVENGIAEFAPRVGSGSKRPGVNAKANIDRFSPVKVRAIRFTISKTNSLEPCLDEVEVFDSSGRNVALASLGTKASASGSKVSPNRHELRFVNDGEYGNSRSWMSSEVGKGWVRLDFAAPVTIERVTWGRDRQGKFADRLAVQYRIEVLGSSGKWVIVADSSDREAHNPSGARVPIDIDSVPKKRQARARQLLAKRDVLLERLASFSGGKRRVFAGTFRKPDVIHRLRRGDPEQPLERIVPAVLSAVGSLKLSADAPELGRREALAEWISSPDNPLTARVMVNRIWQWHFGVGLVETPNDFGRNGSKPTHPELLDWLAGKFVRSGWSMRKLHREIVLSSTYRQSTKFDSVAASKDADSRLLWRYPPRRLNGEAIRDSILSVSGRLNTRMGGRGFDLFDKRGGLTGFEPVQKFEGEGLRRMIYAHKVRRERDAVFGAFDCPDAGQSTPRRRESTTPIQALNLFNSRFVLDRAAELSQRVREEVRGDVRLQIRRAYLLCLSREPSEAEIREAIPAVEEHGLSVLNRALFNCNEFLFLP